ncbi:acyltransferase [Oerskovia sp. M15]
MREFPGRRADGERRGGRSGRRRSGALAAAMLWMPWDAVTTYRGGLVVVSLATAGVINLVLHAPRLGAVLDRGPLGWVGARSYGLYLWHWPVLVLAAALAGGGGVHASPGPWVALTATVVTFCAAAVSYRFVERPVIGRGLVGFLRTASAWLRRGATGRNPLAVHGWVTVAASVVVVGLAAAGVVRAPAVSSVEAQILAAGRWRPGRTSPEPGHPPTRRPYRRRPLLLRLRPPVTRSRSSATRSRWRAPARSPLNCPAC